MFNKQIITVFVGKKISSLKKSSGVTDDPLSNHLSNIDDVDDCDDDYLDSLDAPKQDDEWHKLESITFENSIAAGGKIDIPQTLQYLITQMDSNFSNPPPFGNPTARLEWLEMHLNDSIVKRSGSLERQELMNFFELCNDQLSRFWKDDQRVQVVKMAIQLSKMLSPDSMTTLFPTIYFLVTDVSIFFHLKVIPFLL